MSRNRSPIFLSWPTLFFVGVASLTTHGKLLAAPQPAKTDIIALAPEKCALAVAWTGEIKPDLEGANIERWLAQPEILDGWDDLKKLIETAVTDAPDAEKEMAKLGFQVGMLAPLNPWIFYLDTFEMENPALRFALQLGDAEADIKNSLAAVKTELGDKAKTISVDGAEFHSFKPSEQSPTIEFGIHQGYLVAATGEGSLETLIANFSTPAPAWTTALRDELPIKRFAGMFRVDTASLMKLANAEGDVPAELHLEEMEEVLGVIGLEDGETVTRIALHCPKELRGILKSFEIEPMKLADLDGVPDSLQSLFAARFSPDRIWEILTTNEDSAPEMAAFSEELKENLGIDFEKDAIEAFDDFMYSYQSISMVNPASGAIMAVRLRNPENFSVRLTEVVEEYNDNDSMDYNIETEEMKTGTLYRLVPKDLEPDFGMAVPMPCFLLNDNELLIALEDKAISTHLRKRGREGGRLTADQRVADLFDDQKNGKRGQPLAVHYLDQKSIIEVVYGIVPMIMGGFPGEDGDADDPLESLPPLEVITNGIKADVVGIYRTEKGFELWGRATLPGATLAVPLIGGAVFMAREAVVEPMAPEFIDPEMIDPERIEAEESLPLPEEP